MICSSISSFVERIVTESEAVACKCSVKKVFLKSLFNKVAGLRLRLWHKCFPVNIARFLKTPFPRTSESCFYPNVYYSKTVHVS